MSSQRSVVRIFMPSTESRPSGRGELTNSEAMRGRYSFADQERALWPQTKNYSMWGMNGSHAELSICGLVLFQTVSGGCTSVTRILLPYFNFRLTSLTCKNQHVHVPAQSRPSMGEIRQSELSFPLYLRGQGTGDSYLSGYIGHWLTVWLWANRCTSIHINHLLKMSTRDDLWFSSGAKMGRIPNIVFGLLRFHVSSPFPIAHVILCFDLRGRHHTWKWDSYALVTLLSYV